MKIAILGTGAVGKAFAGRLSKLGHEISFGTRNVESTLAKRDAGSIHEFISANKEVQVKTFEEAARWCELAILVTKGANTLDAVAAAGAKNLEGKIVVDVTNPLDFSKGMPPSLIPELSNTNSLGEEIQRRLPKSHVVKTLNTMWNGLMINPAQLNNGDHINYICGNDAASKEKVTDLLKQMGWKSSSLMDLGDITAARATEATLPIWLRVYGAKKSGAFNFSIAG